MSYTGCYSCGADWSQGHFSDDCEECGGGGLERLCLLCGGQCGSYWKRAILDSHDFEVAHWAGRCDLPEEEQKAMQEELMAIMEEKARQASNENL